MSINLIDIPPSIYKASCPNCGGAISASRLSKGSVCTRCLSDDDVEFTNLKELINTLNKIGKLDKLTKAHEILSEFEVFSDIFLKAIGYPPFGPQKSWILRLLQNDSFAIIAPPGLGKTTFGLIASLYYSSKSKKSILIFPTKSLVRQAIDKLSTFSSKSNLDSKVIYFHAGLTESQKQELNKSLYSNDFDIFISTNRFIIDHIEELSNIKYDFLFVDDVDTALKSSKSAQSVLRLIGFSQEAMSRVKELMKVKDADVLFSELEKIRKGILGNKAVVFSSATLTKGNPIFSLLMGFRPGSSVIYLRKIIDAYAELPVDDDKVISLLTQILSKLGSGGLIFVPVDRGQDYAKFLAEKLSDELNVALITSSSTSKIEEFAEGKIDVLIGSATHYGILVRGIDLPWRIKYAIFVGIPKFKFKIGETINLVTLGRILSIIALITKDQDLIRLAGRVRGKLRRLSPAAIAMLTQQAREGKLEDEILNKAYEVVNSFLSNEEILRKISELGDFVISNGNILIPDYLTYIQASGRTSRIYGGDLTTGLSILLVDDKNLFEIFNRKISLILDEINWKELDISSWKIGDTDIRDIIDNINNEREKILKIKKEGGDAKPLLAKVKTVLFIVESPNKAKTISNFFSRPSTRQVGNLRVYETVLEDKVLMVTASGGHVYDLTTDDIGIYGIDVKIGQDGSVLFLPYYNTIKRCKNGHQFTDYTKGIACPKCGSTEIVVDKTYTIENLRRLALEVDEILIGTDPDTEGEKIAWDLYLALRPYNNNIKRAEFHEVTRRAITQAISNPREFNVNLVESQIVRRIEDRWIGFKLSQKVQTDFWPTYCSEEKEKARSKYYNKDTDCSENKNLSAGRVQTPVLNWIVKRYDEYQKTKSRVYFGKIKGLEDITFYVPKQEGVRKNNLVTVTFNEISEVIEDFGPLPPYTTDSLLSDSNQFFGLSAPDTMRIAQDLFELGLITYHRTDSIRISNVGISIAENYLKQIIGQEYDKVFKPRTWGEGGAHEGIRPTKPLDVDQLRLMIEDGELELAKPLSSNHFKVYDIIFRRFISSQLIPLKVRKEVIKFEIKDDEGNIIPLEQNTMELITEYSLPIQVGNITKFIYQPVRRLSKPLLPRLKESGCDNLPCDFSLSLEGSFLRSKVNLYTQADLVIEMKNKEIGRPSTYATIINTILKRRYAIESKKTKKMIPTSLGKAVNKYLNEKYGNFVSEERTRKLLQLMDMIEAGKERYDNVLKQIYDEINEIR
ncbi:reverse gyrase [Stygiolobus caldivivus]|uniref:Reverse gyrase n=1 Tax=Stygiolobus caldivivus TaxID=2824673 RepID=A0A8D5U8G6_9CREN|nr:reverse gyrase [Stygiolobus caldivivus]BCU70701.1 reverse gyrase [Stygiolobus caldivivus]